jgi:hypothetical protein
MPVMRHFLGFLLGLVLAPLLALGAGWGASKFTELSVTLREHASAEQWAGLAALVGIGLVIGLLASAPWISPVAPLIVGLVYVGYSGFYAAAPRTALDPLPNNDAARYVMQMLGVGVVALVGGALLVSAFMPARWRPASAGDEAGQYAGLPDWSSQPPSAGASAGSGSWSSTSSQPATGSSWSADQPTQEWSSGQSGGSNWREQPSGSDWSSQSPTQTGSDWTTPRSGSSWERPEQRDR